MAVTVTANTTPTQPANSKVDVKTSMPVSVELRLFPAYTTAALNHKDRGESKAISGMPLIFGKVVGGKLQPFDGAAALRKAPSLKAFEAGRLVDELFVEPSTEEIAALSAAKAKAENKKLDKAEREKAKAEYKALNDLWVRKYPGEKSPPLGYHDIPFGVAVEPGTTIGVCINIDAKKKFRNYPLWQITVGNNNVMIDVFETYGPLGLDERVKKIKTINHGTEKAPKMVDHYTARLTGDIWKRSTHPFTGADVDAMPTDRASDAMRTALKKIYAADFTMVGKDFAIDVPRGNDDKDTAAVRLHWLAGENNNCIANIKDLDLKKDIPSRIHPEAYAAAAKAALEANLTEIRFSSSWRPMLGSIAHRAGLGLDVVWLKSNDGATHLNRKTLGEKEGENVSKDEEKAFNEMKQAEQDAATAAKRAKEAAIAEGNAKAAYAKLAKNSRATPEMIAEAKKKAEEATKAREDAVEARKNADSTSREKTTAWKKQMNKDQPSAVANFRSNVMKKPIVKQVLDPWYMDKNTHDNEAPTANDQSDGLEKQHNNHMHITINDPELGIGQ